MEETKIYKVKYQRGIHDLESEYAFHGASQGDENCSNEISDYVAAQGWMISHWKNIDLTNQQAIYDEVDRRKAANIRYIEELHKQGRYGEEYEVSIELVHNPLLDEPSIWIPPITKYKMVFIDFSDDNKKEDG